MLADQILGPTGSFEYFDRASKAVYADEHKDWECINSVMCIAAAVIHAVVVTADWCMTQKL